MSSATHIPGLTLWPTGDSPADTRQATLPTRQPALSDTPNAQRRAIAELDDIDALVRTYRARLLRFITYSTNDPDLAETIAQDTLLKAYNARANFRGDSSINTWLISIAVNLIRDHQRTRKFKFWRQARATAIDVADAASFVPSEVTSPETQFLAREQVGRLTAVLATLSDSQRRVFLLKFTEEMDLQQIAATMGMPVNTVKTHMHRALKAVRSRLAAPPAADEGAAK